MYMIITDLFDIDIHIFTVIKFLFNLGVRFNYICISNGSNERMDITFIYSVINPKGNKCI